MPPRSSLPFFFTHDARTPILEGLLIAAIVVAALYVGREVLLPLALAILLSFVLTPPLLLLRRIKVPRAIAVGIVVSCAFAITLGVGWLISREATQLAADLPSYQHKSGWDVDDPILSIGGRTSLDEAAEAMLAGLLQKRGLGAKALPPETLSAARIASLASTRCGWRKTS
jgi:predicted PurR-regulated permease PerM